MKSQPTVDEPHFAALLLPLPVFAQILVAFRLALRAAMAKLEKNELQIAIEACNAVEEISRSGEVSDSNCSRLEALIGIQRTSRNATTLDACQFAVKATKEAEKCIKNSEFFNVTSLVTNCVDAIYCDPTFSKIQVMLIVRSDIDQLRFACEEIHVAHDSCLTKHVLSRLVPCHPLVKFDPVISIEDDYR